MNGPPPISVAGLRKVFRQATTGQSVVAIDRLDLTIAPREVVAIVGQTGCGKSTFLRILNRMHELVPSAALAGEVRLDGQDIYDPARRLTDARKAIGMVFQKPNPFPKSIYDNIAFALRVLGMKDDLDGRVERALRKAALWDEVKDRLKESALGLSGGQQQRLCIARALAVEPEVILMDEPCSALDPIATAKVEELIYQLRENFTIVIVTHNMQQAGRCSNYTAFFYLGRLIEFGATSKIFSNPSERRTEDYITGRFG